MKNNKGFTLVELLVVIAIIGILSTVAVVNLNSARDKAKLVVMQAGITDAFKVVSACINQGGDIEDGGGASCVGTPIIMGGRLCSDWDVSWPYIEYIDYYGCADNGSRHTIIGYLAGIGIINCYTDTGSCDVQLL